ncbi:MAG: hypothetical protein LBK53_09420 [Heliobacteriaceae bacterium]|nr:hypothetical protein [Heliobacteriaceae bacterium]
MFRCLLKFMLTMISVFVTGLSYILCDGLEIGEYSCRVRPRKTKKDIESEAVRKYVKKIAKQVKKDDK